jgi:hypothetical protein
MTILALLIAPEAHAAVAGAITFPLPGMRVAAGNSIVIRGESPLGPVEVSTDGGASWLVPGGGDSWSLPWTPAKTGPATVRVRPLEPSGFAMPEETSVVVEVSPAHFAPCPCMLWPPGTTPGITDDGARVPIEVGVRFRSDAAGEVAAVRFYMMEANCGPHSVHLWTAGGTLLASAQGTATCVNGWHEIAFAAPVPIARDSMYVASVHMPRGGYALWPSTFFQATVDHVPLHAPADAPGAGNGVFSYGKVSAFPDSSFNQSNYWVDVRFETGAVDDEGPLLVAIAPGNGATAAVASDPVTVTLDEPIDEATLTDSSFVLRDGAGFPVPATVHWSPATRTATLEPRTLVPGASYAATIALRDPAGNPLEATWSFTVRPASPPPADEGPGGPILVLASAANPFTRYVPEILRAEGWNAFRVRELSALGAGDLAACAVAILGDAPVDSAQAALLSSWVSGGGRLVVLRPGPQTASLCGLEGPAGILSDAYVKVDGSQAPGAGIVADPMQYHGPADVWNLAPGTRAVAWLYTSAAVPTVHPAVTWRAHGSGVVVAFAYDLARSVVYTHQGNPAWSGVERDGESPLRTVDLFFGAAQFDPEPDWVDFSRLQIPQADEQQRLLANAIAAMTEDRTPLPRFWYLPRGLKAAIVMTGDSHGSDKVAERFDRFIAASDSGCAVGDWGCVRATTYLYSGPGLTDAQARGYVDQGFDVAVHLTASCLMVDKEQLGRRFDEDLGLFAATYPSLPAPTSNRTHCGQWIDFASEAELETARGIRFDATSYFYPRTWVRDTPGIFTGAGLPMRYARLDGSTIDTYLLATIFTDDAAMSIPHNVDVVLDNAVGPRGFYGTFMCNVHHEYDSDHVAEDIVGSAQAHGVPVISAQQLLTWVDGRNRSVVRDLAWGGGVVAFTVVAGDGARGLSTLVPLAAGGDTLRWLMRDGVRAPFEVETIKGRAYARFESPTGRYEGFYRDRPVGTGVAPGQLSLAPVSPNPARGDVRFGLELPVAGEARLALYGVRGNLVRTLVRGMRPAGASTVAWDRRDDDGRAVPPGVYLARLEALGATRTRRVVLLR